MKAFILSLITLLSILILILSCGMNTHQDVAYRGFNFLKYHNINTNYNYTQVLVENPTFFMAGAPFPDWGYACDCEGCGGTAEDTHWQPFTRKYINFMKEKYQVGTERYNKLLAFLFGIEVHQISDIVWHWGQNIPGTDDQGFLHTMGHLSSDCKDYWENCHGRGDTGGDIYLAYKLDVHVLSQLWSIPLDDIIELYVKIGEKIPAKNKMIFCLLKMFLGAKLEKIGSIIMLSQNEKLAQFLTESLELYFHGGLDDMAAHTVWTWENVIKIIEGKEFVENNQKLVEKNGRTYNKNMQKMTAKLINKVNVEYFMKLTGVNYKLTNDGDLHFDFDIAVYNENKERLLNVVRNILYPRSFEMDYFRLDKNIRRSELIKINEMIPGPIEMGYYGKSITFGKFNGSENVQKVIGAPGYGFQHGAIYLDDLQDPFIVGDEYSRFGYSLTTVDFNHDGIDDLVVSAPSYGENGPSSRIEDSYIKKYFGKIYIYFGSKDGLSKTPNTTIEINHENGNIFYNLGMFLNSGDCNNDGFKDLIIGSPYASLGGDKKGNVSLFYTWDKYRGKNIISLESDNDLYLTGDFNYQEFGTSFACSNNQIIVGAPGARYQNSNEILGAGSVTGYNLEGKQIFKIESNQQQTRFGYSLDISNDILAVGAHGYSEELGKNTYQTGIVLLYDMKLLTGKTSNFKLDALLKLESNHNRAKFGKKILFWREGLIVGMPHFSIGFLKNETGSILYYNKISTRLESKDNKPTWEVKGINNGGRFGEYIFTNNDSIYVSTIFESVNKSSGSISIVKP